MFKKHFTGILLLLLTFSFAQTIQETAPISIEEVKREFKGTEYSDELIIDFIKTIGKPEIEPLITEFIPNHIIGWSLIDRSYAIQEVYMVKGQALENITVKPSSKEFLEKLNSYVPKESRFTYSSDLWSFPFVEREKVNDEYVIRATVTSYNSHPMMPSDDILLYDIQYTTIDFKTFRLIKLKNIHSKEWIEVKD